MNVLDNQKVINNIDAYVGHRVRCIRMALGMTQRELADKIGISFQQLQKNEKGDNKISCSRLYTLSLVLGVSIEYFFEGLPNFVSNSSNSLKSDFFLSYDDEPVIDNEHDSKSSTLLGSKEVIEVVKYYNKLHNPELKKAIVGFLKLCKHCN